MNFALLALGFAPGYWVTIEHGSATAPIKLVVHSEVPADRNLSVAVTVTSARRNGKWVRLRLVGNLPHPVLSKGKTSLDLNLRSEPAFRNSWVQAHLLVKVGGQRAASSFFRFIPPVGEALRDELGALRKRFIGKLVWVYGGDVYDHSIANGYVRFIGTDPVKVAAVVHNGSKFVLRLVPNAATPIGSRDEHRQLAPMPVFGKDLPSFFYVVAESKLQLIESLSLRAPDPSRNEADMRGVPSWQSRDTNGCPVVARAS